MIAGYKCFSTPCSAEEHLRIKTILVVTLCRQIALVHPLCATRLPFSQESTDVNLASELGEEMLSGEVEVTDLWSVITAEEALGKFG